ncbi:VWA domain-containing protein [Oxalobacteraceae bacterium CAVE-383]|nr:VWA domain-containing protein [Oxalobacteraceae bacterium CAVE-383]
MSYYPFSAIVGQPDMKLALLLCAIDTSLGGVLICGDKGSAKSTASRALTAVLPAIKRRPGCLYNCVPEAPCAVCTVCNVEHPEPGISGTVPFVTLPLGATEDRVIGALDLERAIRGATTLQAFKPGMLATAHRGVLYIDEVNLLSDHLVDVLLDVAAMGVNTVQREGMSLSHPARFTLIGTMNPEEGDLRPQLLDRFGLMVDVLAPRDKALRTEVVRRRIAFEADPEGYAKGWEREQLDLRRQIYNAQCLAPDVEVSDALLELISHLCCEFEVASMRADIVMYKAVRALAALDGRNAAAPADVRTAAELVLPHRRRRKPFEHPGLDRGKLDQLMQDAPKSDAGQSPRGGRQHAEKAETVAASGDDSESDIGSETETTQGHDGGRESGGDSDRGPDNDSDSDSGRDSDRDSDSESEQDSDMGSEQNTQVFLASANAANAAAPRIRIVNPRASSIAGRRNVTANAERGRTVRIVADPDVSAGAIAVGATLRAANLRHKAMYGRKSTEPISLMQSDLRRQVKEGKRASLILFVVDASGSMAAQRRMETVKGAVLSLLTDAYQRRDQVAVIAFGGPRATMLLAPTRSVDQAEEDLRELPTGGRTPLPHALQLALTTVKQAGNGKECAPILILLSDGKANVALAEGGDAWQESLALAEQLAANGVASLVLDTENGYLRLGRAAQLAQVLGAQCVGLDDLGADATHSLALAVKGRMS